MQGEVAHLTRCEDGPAAPWRIDTMPFAEPVQNARVFHPPAAVVLELVG
jgi:hypothetical protein